MNILIISMIFVIELQSKPAVQTQSIMLFTRILNKDEFSDIKSQLESLGDVGEFNRRED